ncbi:hypothetical protein UT300007_26310 [Clostridium sp. CTA-7]
MIIGNTKWVYLSFMPYEFRAIEEYLDKEALRGWKLEKIKGNFLKLKKTEPKSLKYTVDVLDEIAFIDGENTEKSMEYREFCNMAGWEFICEKDKFQIYCSEDPNESIPIHTDEGERFEIVKKATTKYEFSVLIINLFLLYIAYTCITNGSFLADNLILLYLGCISVRVVLEVIQFIDFMRWNIKAQKSLEKGEEVSYNGRKNVAIKSFLQKVIEITLVALIILMGIDMGRSFVTIMVLYLIVGVIPYIIKYFINKTDGNNIKRRNLYGSSVFYLLLVEIVVIILLFESGIMNYDYKSKDVISNKVNTITIEDLGYEIKNEENTYIKEDNGLFADNINYHVESNAGYMSYQLFTSKYKWAIDYKLKNEFKRLRKLDIKYEEIESSLSEEGIKMYSNKYGNEIVIVSDKVYLDISCWDKELRNSEILNKVLEKIFEVKK